MSLPASSRRFVSELSTDDTNVYLACSSGRRRVITLLAKVITSHATAGEQIDKIQISDGLLIWICEEASQMSTPSHKSFCSCFHQVYLFLRLPHFK